jgi:hypothetical protein
VAAAVARASLIEAVARPTRPLAPSAFAPLWVRPPPENS